MKKVEKDIHTVESVKHTAKEYAQRYGDLKLMWSELWDIEKDFRTTWPNNSLPGCYAIFDSKKSLLYIGKAVHLGRRLSSYFRYDETKTKGIPKSSNWGEKPPQYILTVGLEHKYEAPSLEEYLIYKLQPAVNIQGIKVT